MFPFVHIPVIAGDGKTTIDHEVYAQVPRLFFFFFFFGLLNLDRTPMFLLHPCFVVRQLFPLSNVG